jgi:hypothetical protein
MAISLLRPARMEFLKIMIGKLREVNWLEVLF